MDKIMLNKKNLEEVSNPETSVQDFAALRKKLIRLMIVSIAIMFLAIATVFISIFAKLKQNSKPTENQTLVFPQNSKILSQSLNGSMISFYLETEAKNHSILIYDYSKKEIKLIIHLRSNENSFTAITSKP